MRLPTALLLLAALLPHVPAQLAGGDNRSAPTVSEKITFFGDTSIEVKYRAITFGRGQFLDRLRTSEEFRERINGMAPSRPLGSLKVARGVQLAGKQLAPGGYELYFQVDGDMKWTMVLAAKEGEAKHEIPLALEKVDGLEKRLDLDLDPVASDEEATLAIRFGRMHVELPVKESAS